MDVHNLGDIFEINFKTTRPPSSPRKCLKGLCHTGFWFSYIRFNRETLISPHLGKPRCATIICSKFKHFFLIHNSFLKIKDDLNVVTQFPFFLGSLYLSILIETSGRNNFDLF